MHTTFLLDGFAKSRDKDFLVWHDRTCTYGWLLDAVERWRKWLSSESIPRGSVVSLEADFSPESVALLLALVEQDAVIVPLSSSVQAQKQEFCQIAEVEAAIRLDAEERIELELLPRAAGHELILTLKKKGHPGLVLFSSGSTGKSKAAIHDVVPLLEKFKVRRNSLRTITFLLFDHIGGINTLFYSLSNAGCIVTVPDRKPETVCRSIAKHKVQLLPTSPTFVNLILVSEAYRKHDLSSLEMVTYGTEVMPQSTLQ